MENKPSGGRFIASLLFFAMTAAIAVLLLLTALVVWLSSVTGSFIVSALILGGLFALLAFVIYLLAIRDAVDHIRSQGKRHPLWNHCFTSKFQNISIGHSRQNDALCIV